jgi:hypothetical protein
MTIRLPVSYARIHAKVVEHSQKLDGPSQRTLIRPLKFAAPFVLRQKSISAKG